MGRSDYIYTVVKIQIDLSKVEPKALQRLRQILGRDTRIIKRYLGIIHFHNKDLLQRLKKSSNGNYNIDKGGLDILTLKSKFRDHVQHDFKSEFPRTSLNEFKELRDSTNIQ